MDLLTQLTWPIESDDHTATMARYLHVPALQRAQASYKGAVLQHPNTEILRTVARVSLPSLAQTKEERTPTDDSIIKVVLYFFRNISLISPPTELAIDEVESGIDRSSTIDQFHYQDIFNVILTICSAMTDDFQTHEVEILDTVFQLVKGIDVDSLFMDKQEVISANTKELLGLMSKEKGMLASFARYAPSRHNRFGTMLWIQRDDGRKSTVFGQKGAAVNEQLSMAEMDLTKKWKRPRGPRKRDAHEQPPAVCQHLNEALTRLINLSQAAVGAGVELTAKARGHLRSFVEQFLDSSFNPLFLAVRRAIELEEARVFKTHTRQYLYLISWFLRADRIRRQKRAADRAVHPSSANDPESFALIATVLNQETFVLLNRSMQKAHDERIWEELNAGMKCFTQILLTVQDMSESTLDEDQEIAENILNRIFYEQTTHDRIIALLRSYKDQGFDYLDACTELSHVFLRLLERYSKQNVDLQVRTRRRARRKKAADATNGSLTANDDLLGIEPDEVAEVQRQSTERKFDFNRFSARFINQASVDTFVALLRFFNDLSQEQLKRAHRFFYRVAFKMDLTVYLFRMDIVSLFNRLIKGPNGLNATTSTFKEWEELVRQVFRRLTKKMQERPALAVELLFSKIPSSIYYLEHGYDREVPKKAPRPAAELEVKPGMEQDEQIGVAVSILINQSKSDALAWLKDVLSSAASDRKAWEESEVALASDDSATRHPEGSPSPRPVQDEVRPKAPSIFVKPDSFERRTAVHRDKHLRLLLTVLRFERLTFDAEATETTWIIPSILSSTELSHAHDLINKFEFSPPTYDEGKSAEDLVRRKTEPRAGLSRADFNDSEGESDTDLDALFPAGGPTIIGPSHERNSRSGPKRSRRSKDELLDEGVLEARREARRKLEAERSRKVKSELFVRDSDDESDDERDRAFFEREKKIRAQVNKVVSEAMNLARANQQERRKKRKSSELGDDDDSNDGGFDGLDSSDLARKRRISKKARASVRRVDLSDADSDIETLPRGVNTPVLASRRSRNDRRRLGSNIDDNDDDSDSSGSGGEQTSRGNLSAAETEAETDTPPSSERPSTGRPSQTSRLVMDVDMSDVVSVGSGSDKENGHPGPMKAAQTPVLGVRRNVRAGFVIESDSDE